MTSVILWDLTMPENGIQKSGCVWKWQPIHSKTNFSLHPTGKCTEDLRFRVHNSDLDQVLFFFFFPPIYPYLKKSEHRLQWGHSDKVTVGMRCQQGFSEPKLYEAWKFYSGKEWAAETGFHSTAMETALWDSASRPSETEASLPFLLQHPPPYHMPPTPHKWIKGRLRKWGPNQAFT